MVEGVPEGPEGEPKLALPSDRSSRSSRRPSGSGRWRGFRTATWTLVVFGALVGLVLLRVQSGVIDYAVANFLTLLLAVIVVVALITRVFFGRNTHWLTRWLPIAGVAFAILACCALLRVDRVSGRMVPRFVWRWSERPDRLLGAPVIAEGDPVDVTTVTPEDFPQFLGPRRDLIVTGTWLDREWGVHSPRALWRQPVGAGWSGFSAVNGFAITMEQRGDDELVACYEVVTGKPRWVHTVAARHESVMGGVGPRCTPTIDGGLVYALGATGMLRCLDGRTGALVWSDNILERYHVTPEQDLQAVAWGRSASPLVVENQVIIPFGGPKDGPYASLAAYDKRTGQLLWTGGECQVSYASPSLTRLCGEPQIVIVNESSASGHRVEDGSVLWSWDWPGGSTGSASVSQAVTVSENRLLLSKDYGVGAALIELARDSDGKWQVSEVWAKRSVLKTKFTNVAVRDGFAYGLSDGILECIEVGTGKTRWKKRRGDYGPGQLLMVEDVILVQAECGDVVMVEVNPAELVELGRFPALTDQTWNNLCLYGRYLLVRNSVEAACYELPLREAR